jgi:hypothetical protein
MLSIRATLIQSINYHINSLDIRGYVTYSQDTIIQSSGSEYLGIILAIPIMKTSVKAMASSAIRNGHNIREVVNIQACWGL